MLARERASRVDDAVLIERVLRRDEQAWRELVRANKIDVQRISDCYTCHR